MQKYLLEVEIERPAILDFCLKAEEPSSLTFISEDNLFLISSFPLRGESIEPIWISPKWRLFYLISDSASVVFSVY